MPLQDSAVPYLMLLSLFGSPVLSPDRWDRSPEPAAESDVGIMTRVSLGDETALGELLDRYWKVLVKYAVGFVGDLDSAEDLVQDAFVRVWQSRSNWTPSGSTRAYLYRIVRNLALQEREKRGVRQRFVQAEVSPDGPPTPAEDHERGRVRSALQAAVETLSPRRREILTLARFHGLSYQQIADIMGISPQTVANQLSSALKDLRKKLAPKLR